MHVIHGLADITRSQLHQYRSAGSTPHSQSLSLFYFNYSI